MKKFLAGAAALLFAVVSLAAGNVAYAAEDVSAQDPLVIDVPEAYLRVTVPESYEYVFDQKQIYRGDLDPDFDISLVTQQLTDGNIYVDAFSYVGDYTVEAYVIYDPATSLGSVKNLSAYTDDDINDYNTKMSLSSASDDPNYFAHTSNVGVYRSQNGITYGHLKTVVTEGLGGPQTLFSRIMWTVVDGKVYEIYLRSDDPESSGSDYEEDIKAFADSVAYLNAPDEDEIEAEQTAIYGANGAQIKTRTVEEVIEDIKNDEDASKTMGQIEAEREQARETSRMYRILTRILVVVIGSAIAAGVKKARDNKNSSGISYNDTHGKRDDDYIDRF